MRLVVELQAERASVARVDAVGVADVRRVSAPQTPTDVAQAVRVVAERSPEHLDSLSFSVDLHDDWPAQVAAALDVPYRQASRAACLAWGEHIGGSARGLGDVLYLRWGDTVAAGLVLEGRPWLRPLDVAHLPIDARGPLCPCGARGCLGTFVGSEALDRTALALGVRRNQPAAGLHDPGLHAELAWRAQQGEPTVLALVRHAADNLGGAAAILARQFAVRHVVLHVQRHLQQLPVHTEVARVLARQAGPGVELHAAALGDEASLIGAANLP